MPSLGKRFHEFPLKISIELGKLGLPILIFRLNPVIPQPDVAVRVPAIQYGFGDRVACPPGDKAKASRLRPMWQFPFDDREFCRSIECLQRPEL